MKRKLEDLDVKEFLKKYKIDHLSDEDDIGQDSFEETGDEGSVEDEESLDEATGYEESSSDKTERKNKPSENEPGDESEEEDSVKHKESLKNLKETDPEFYQFLEENDKGLLNFEEDSNSEADSEDTDESSRKHVPPSSLEVASDESDDEDDDEDDTTGKRKGRITSSMLKQWSKELNEVKPISTLIEVITAFKCAVEQVSTEDEPTPTRVQSSKTFNSLLKLCLVDVVPALSRSLNAPSGGNSFQPTTSKAWKKLQIHVKTYLMIIIKVLSLVHQVEIVKTILKHVLQLVPYFISFPKVSKGLLKRMIRLWSTSEESIRVLSLMAIIRITRAVPSDLLPFVINKMYVSYVKNCNFTSPTTWPMINFMKHSLVEIFALDESLSYQHAFIYIRQMAIHLRNAVTVKKKDAIKTVYNWQFVHCIYLWSQMMCTLHSSAVLQPLIYPLVQITIGTIKLIPTSKYIPLRFHCVRALTALSKETNTFIPLFPILTEVFDFVDFKKQHTKVSWKPMDFICALKLSKAQICENGFKDGLIDQFYELILDYAVTQSHTVAFPELILPSILRMKAFTKINKVGNYNKQIKQLIEKLEENAQFIEKKRSTAVLNLSDAKAMDAWENASKQASTPLMKYYETYRKLRDREVLHEITKKDQLEDKFPTIERNKKADKEEFADLFADDSSDDDSFLLKNKEVSSE